MKITCLVLVTKLFLIIRFEKTEGQRTAIDDFLPQYRLFRDFSLGVLRPTSRDPKNLRLAQELHILQPRLNADVPFPCSVKNTRSPNRPKSVHALKPGDIDIVGTLGDSISAGNGLVATNLLHVSLENRGVAFSGGGQGTWREFVTLPNILKEFNPNLIGFSTKDGFGHHKSVNFNAAEAGAMSRDTPYMSRILIKRMQNDHRVNIAEDWKMVSIMIGPNDFCVNMCYYKNLEKMVEAHKKDLLEVLRTLRDNLPRTIVNVIIAPNLRVLANVTLTNRPPTCYFTQVFLCPCLFGLQYEHLQNKFEEIMYKWQDVEQEVANYPEFDTDDFTVVAQPFTKTYVLPKTPKGLTDYLSLSQDCFHLSQKEGARAALSLWNNILEPVGRKNTGPSELFHLKCPSKSHPFIFTRRNSGGVVR